MENELREKFLNAFPEKFLKRLYERQASIYQQTVAMSFQDQPWDSHEAYEILPHIRRATMEAAMRKSAIEAGLRTANLPHKGKNCGCVHVKSAGFTLTGHYVCNPKEFVREAESRKQNRGLNQWLDYHIDERLLVRPAPRLDSRPVYVNLLYGGVFPSRKNDTLTLDPTTFFLNIAVPSADMPQYQWAPWSVQDLLRRYAEMPASQEEPQAVIADTARPTKKRKA
jgi:hypothetical protein